jgi:small-conductance mechanosensitive channel
LRLPANAFNLWIAAVLAAAILHQPGAALAKGAEDKAAEKKEQKLPDPLTKEAIRELAARLTDAEVRQLLIQQLDRAAAPAEAKPGDMSGMVASMDRSTQLARQRAGVLMQALLQLPDTLRDAHDRFSEGRGAGHLQFVAMILAAALALSYFAERLYRLALRTQRLRLDERHCEGFAANSARNLLRFLYDLGGVAVFGGAALAMFYVLYQGHEPTRLLVLTVIGAAVLLRLTVLGSRFLLEPRAPALRLLPFGDGAARRIHSGVLQIAVLYLVGIFPAFLLLRLGASVETAQAIGLLIGALLLASTIATLWAVRHDVGAMIRGPGEASPLARLVAEIWPVLATAYLLPVYLAAVLDALAGRAPEGKGILSLLLLIALPMVDLLLTRALHAAMSARAARTAATAHRAPSAVAATYEPVLRKAIHIVVAVTGVLMLAGLWGIDFMRLAERGLGEQIAGQLFEVGIILLVAYLLWELAKTVVAHLSEREGMPAARTDDEMGAAVASRLGTLLPLIRGTLRVTILVVAVLSVLAALGINVLPLLAGAGVVGVAIGFGSQTLVRDIVSGAFFLADDAFRVGEYIEVGESKGTVEQIRLRSLFLRHHRGAINVLPYGEIRRLRNQSRDWVIDKMTIGITYDSDLEKARKLIKKIGQELAADPELAPKTIEPLKMQGVEQFGDFAIQIRMKMKTLPGEQFVIRRKAFAMIKKAFDENGIKFAFPTVQVAGGSGPVPDGVVAAASQAQPQSK